MQKHNVTIEDGGWGWDWFFSYNFIIIYKREQHMHEIKKLNPNHHIWFQKSFHESEKHDKTNDASQRSLSNV